MQRTITLKGGSPWGFRLVGGSDFRANLAISKVTPGGKADLAGLKPGDVIVEINNNDTGKLSHLDAQNLVKSSTSSLILKVDSQGAPRTASPPAPKPVVQNNTTPTPPKPSTFTPASAAPAAKTWQPVRPKPASAPSATVTNDDFLPPPPTANELQQAHTTSSDDFPAPPPVTVPITTQQASTVPGQELTCEGCKQKIRGAYLTAQGKNWHPEEFVCSSPNCRRSLQHCGFVEEKGQRYCSDCYEKYFAHSCGKCHKKIVGEVMHALNQTWHVTCFVCTACSQPFRDGVFQLEHDKPYCVADFNKLFGSKCKGCGFAIEAGDHYVEAIKAQWHDKCFTCTICHCDLKNAGFFAVNNKPVCSNHKNARVPA